MNAAIKYKQTYTYHATIDLPYMNGYVFNHGTETKKGSRVASHIRDCAAQMLVYNCFEEKNDRVFGSDVISSAYDSEFIKRVVDDLNQHSLKNCPEKAIILSAWKKSLKTLPCLQRGTYDALCLANLSETECCFIPQRVSDIELKNAIARVEKTWYYATKHLRVSAKPYANKTDKEKSMAAKPIPIAFNKKIIDVIHYKVSEAELITMRLIRVQSIILSYTLSCMPIFKNVKFRVIITADDIEKHQDTYDAIKNNSRFEFIICESDEEVIEEYLNMTIKPDLDIMNPPYDGSLHLEILSKVLENKKPGATVVSVQPARWIEDPLAEYKQGSDYKKYKTNIVDKLSYLGLINVLAANNSFKITADQDLAIYLFNDTKDNIEIYSKFIKSIIEKINAKKLPACSNFIEKERVDGWRCETFKVKSLGQATTVKNSENTYTSDGWEYMISGDKGYYYNGKCADGRWWTENRQATQHTRKVGEPFAQSFKFNFEQECANFYASTHTLFYINLVYMLKTDMNLSPVLNHLPYMEDYSHVWTDEDYCKFFDLTEDESKFMCRKVDDYRVKDFIKYINLDED